MTSPELDLERFWAKVDKGGECWAWAGALNPDGYGTFSIKGKNYRAHRWLYEQTHGPLPRHIFVCHHCDNPRCVRLDHLFAGTSGDNLRDAGRKGRHALQRRPDLQRRLGALAAAKAARGERVAGAKLTPDDVIVLRFMHLFGVSEMKLAAHFGMAKSAVRKVALGHTWRHVPGLDVLRAALAALPEVST